MRTGFLFGLGLLALSACAVQPDELTWVKPGHDGIEAEQVMARCKFEAAKATPDHVALAGDDWMSEAINEGRQERRLTTLCMQADGWQALPPSKL